MVTSSNGQYSVINKAKSKAQNPSREMTRERACDDDFGYLTLAIYTSLYVTFNQLFYVSDVMNSTCVCNLVLFGERERAQEKKKRS